MSTKSQGALGEEYALVYLEKRGYKIIETNFKSIYGEIDIIAKDGDSLVFVEVKTRWGEKYGRPEEAVTVRKLSRIKKTAEYFCLVNNCFGGKERIEVIAIEVEEGEVKSLKHIFAD